MTKSPDSSGERAAEAWRSMFEFLMRSAPQRLRTQQEHGLTPNDSRALFSLDEDGRPIGVLAREWGCDPSTATWLVDRLERAELAERIPSPDDRRVKLVRATKKGLETKTVLMAAYHRPPAEMSSLSPRELDELTRICRKLCGR
ncbi:MULTISPECIES: MarR family winged helix-turn-helix transcriptional regulator [Cupriavidus]|jgi:Transcriptional regulators|uniref:MarR family transcriptional regulator n=1 Tax=Cupriavidus cauae TaxID=2608999 RepID=A0A5M8A898_9BURK|nr:MULTISPECIES: MarR family transcriptional regulator [Cupriavidus]KAA0181332.1 MarR family transcriptional regulator [Cupriavidus gilardii]KAA6118305.1 MarR family transcriptional regulator [Cupriavidus cauae]MCA7085188.1 MarR family transcriptional regulator [Cupriavidus sp. DB3]